MTRRERGRWSLAHGPFRCADFRALPARNWTLLVQGVNLHLAAADALLRRFAFVPYARLDDILRTLIAWQLNAESATWAPPARLLARLVPALAWTAVAASRPIFRVREPLRDELREELGDLLRKSTPGSPSA